MGSGWGSERGMKRKKEDSPQRHRGTEKIGRGEWGREGVEREGREDREGEKEAHHGERGGSRSGDEEEKSGRLTTETQRRRTKEGNGEEKKLNAKGAKIAKGRKKFTTEIAEDHGVGMGRRRAEDSPHGPLRVTERASVMSRSGLRPTAWDALAQ